MPATAADAAADAAAVLVDLPSPRAPRPAAAAAGPGGQLLVRFIVEKDDLQAAADVLKVGDCMLGWAAGLLWSVGGCEDARLAAQGGLHAGLLGCCGGWVRFPAGC